MSHITAIPDFSALDVAATSDALEALLAAHRAELDTLLATWTAAPDHLSWNQVIGPLEAQQDRLDCLWGPIVHLNAVQQTPELRAIYHAALPKLSGYYTDLAQNAALYRIYQQLRDQPAFADYSPTQQKLITDALRDFDLSGIGLPPAQQARYKALMAELSQLQAQFHDQVADATALWTRHITDVAALDGLPQSTRALLRQAAKQQQRDGYWLTLDLPCYLPVMSYARDRALREALYTAYATRASDQGPFAGQHDNGPVMQHILAKRQELAQLLGFATFADYSLATKMASSAQEVEQFLMDLVQRAKPRAEAELAELQTLAAADGVTDFAPWDVSYYTEQLRQERYALSPETLRPYFPLPHVLDGIFALFRQLLAVDIAPLPHENRWHPKVQCFAVRSPAGDCGRFYLDLFSREHKRSGAWMDGSVSRRRIDGAIRPPLAYLVANFTPPVDGQPALLTHSELLTLLHEFGHGLHHLLTQVDYPALAGTRGVEWDAVELPSQWLENWGWQREVLRGLSCHVQTGDPLPDALFDKLERSRHFHSGILLLRQLEFALFDLRLHRQPVGDGGVDIPALIAPLRREIAVIHPPAWNRFAHTFGHIFGGGYAAGYYSYQWAEVLSADAFAAFEEAPTLLDASVGTRFRTEILEMGGARPAAASFMAFRGRAPQIDALLRHRGLS